MDKIIVMKKYHVLIIISLTISILLFFIGLLIYGYVDNAAKFGNLLSGTLGIGVSAGAMIAVYGTLKEQQKMHKEQLIENLNSRYEGFMLLYRENKEHLHELWMQGDSYYRRGVETLLTSNLRNNTFDALFNICEDPELQQLSNNLNGILMQIEILHRDFKDRVDEIRDSIPYACKKYAGFYFVWNRKKFESRLKSQEVLNENMASVFLKEMRKMPEEIPQIIVYDNETLIPFEKEKLKNYIITIESRSEPIIFVKNIYVEKEKWTTKEVSIITNKNEYPISKLFDFEKFYNIIKYLRIEQDNKAHQTFLMEIEGTFNNKEWIYECILEFNLYYIDQQYKASIIFKQIEDGDYE
jgi:hypothetical protein